MAEVKESEKYRLNSSLKDVDSFFNSKYSKLFHMVLLNSVQKWFKECRHPLHDSNECKMIA